MITRRYAGSEWIAQAFRVELSPLGTQAADLLGEVFAGIYHLNRTSLSKVEWSNPDYIAVTIRGGLSTFDSSDLTRLVLFAHAMCLRVDVSGAAPGYLRLTIYPRTREGGMWQRHPTIAGAVAEFEKYYPEVESVL